MNSVLILGGSSDIAVSIAEVFLKKGYEILLAGRNLERLNLIKNDLEIRYDSTIEIKPFDALEVLTHHEFVQSLNPLPNITICAFGYLGDQDRAKNEVDECLRIIQVNYVGAVSVLNALSERYKQHRQGVIVGLSSVAGDRARQSNFLYGSAKAAFTNYLAGLRNEMFHYGCHVLTVKPGFVDTKMTRHLQLPSLLTAQPEQVAKAVYRGLKRRRNTIYVLGIWRWIMLIIRLIPESIFKRLKM